MISLLYPIKNRITLLVRTINSILSYCDSIKNKFEIIILDSGSNDNLDNYIISLKMRLDIRYVKYNYPNILLRHNPAYAFNLGFKLSKYDSIVLTSPEIRHKTNVIKQLLDHTGKNVLCKVLNEDKNKKLTPLFSSAFRGQYPGLYFVGMYNRNDYFSIGGIDEDFMRGESCEDQDFGDRFLRAGLKYEVHDEIIGIHTFHERVKRSDKTYAVNKKIWDDNKKNKLIKANEKIIMGNVEYINRII